MTIKSEWSGEEKTASSNSKAKVEYFPAQVPSSIYLPNNNKAPISQYQKPTPLARSIKRSLFTFSPPLHNLELRICSHFWIRELKWGHQCWDPYSREVHLLWWTLRRHPLEFAVDSHRNLLPRGKSPFWVPPEGSASLWLCLWSLILSSPSSPSTISLALLVSPPMLATSIPDLRSFYSFSFSNSIYQFLNVDCLN